jgi:hypothetical protein
LALPQRLFSSAYLPGRTGGLIVMDLNMEVAVINNYK